jgi:hypothetical protein
MSNTEEKILNQKIVDLPFSEDFKTFSKKLGFTTVADIVTIHASDLIQSEGFTYHMLQEFTQFMQENKLSHLIKQH